MRSVMKAVKLVMLIKGMDPTVISVFYDLIDLESRMIKRRKKQKPKPSAAEVFLRRETLDSFVKAQLWHLGLVVLKMRKAAKEWHIRFDLIKRLSATEKFITSVKPSSRVPLAGENLQAA